MLSNRFPINKNILKTFGIKEEPGSVVIDRVRQWTKAELKRQAETLRPFLFDEGEAQWITDAPLIVPALFAKYKKGESLRT